MRTNIEIDEKLIAQAMKVSGAKTKREVVEKALQEMVRRATTASTFMKLRGKIEWEGDLDALRRDR